MLPLRASACAALAALTLTACGQASSQSASTSTTVPPKLSPVRLAAVSRATTKAGSYRIAMRMTIPTASGTVHMRAGGAFTTAYPQSGAMTIGMNGPTAIRMSEKILWPDIYIKSSALQQSLPGSKPWLHLSVRRLPGGAALDTLAGASNDNASQALAYLKGASTGIRNLGIAQIRGDATTHYRATVDFDKVLAALPPKARAAMRPAIAKLTAASGASSMPMDFWIDADHRLRAERYSIASPDGSGAMTFRIELYGFGVPVHVARPPASQVSELPAS